MRHASLTREQAFYPNKMSRSSWRVLTFVSLWYFSFANSLFFSRAIGTRAKLLMNLTVQHGKKTTKWKLIVKQPSARGCIWLTSLFWLVTIAVFSARAFDARANVLIRVIASRSKIQNLREWWGRRASGVLLGSKSLFSCSYHLRSSSCWFADIGTCYEQASLSYNLACILRFRYSFVFFCSDFS